MRGRSTRGQILGRAARTAKADARYRTVIECAEQGMDVEDAASRAGLTRKGLLSLLWRKTGSTAWPPVAAGGAK